MAVVKLYCTNCGQRVSGDESFFGTTVHCPVCNSEITFPKAPAAESASPPPASPMPASGIIPPPPAAGPAMGSGVSKSFAGGGVTTPMPRHPSLRTPLIGPPPGTGAPASSQPLPSAGTPQTTSAGSPLPGAGAGQPLPPAGTGLKSSSVPAQDAPAESEDDRDPGVMPLLVLGSGIASIALCSGFLVLSAVAIVGGHLTMMRLDEAGIREGRNKAVAGTLLGYVSVFLFLIAAIAVKFAWPALQKLIHAG